MREKESYNITTSNYNLYINANDNASSNSITMLLPLQLN